LSEVMVKKREDGRNPTDGRGRGGRKADWLLPSESVAEAVEPEEGEEPAVAVPPHAAVVDGANGLAVRGDVMGHDQNVIGDGARHGSTPPARRDSRWVGVWDLGEGGQSRLYRSICVDPFFTHIPPILPHPAPTSRAHTPPTSPPRPRPHQSNRTPFSSSTPFVKMPLYFAISRFYNFIVLSGGSSKGPNIEGWICFYKF
jgi:hypothetical protein